MEPIGLTWIQLRDMADNKFLPIVYYENNNNYFLFISDGTLPFTSVIRQDTPRNTDQIDFEDNGYQTAANDNDTALGSKIVGRTGALAADVVLKNFEHALVTTGTLTAEVVAGFDDFADTWVFITNAGNIGDTIRFEIAAQSYDPSSPSRNHPAVDITVTITATEAGDEVKLVDLCISTLNADTNFLEGLRASKIQNPNGILHIGAKDIAEAGERPNVGDFKVTTTGATDWAFQGSDNDKIIRRNKGNSGQRDPRDQRLVTQGISGIVQAVPGAAGDIFFQNATDDGTPSMEQGGTGDPDLRTIGTIGSPSEFFIPPDPEKDIFITELRFYGGGNGIKYGNFLSKNAALTNGILVEIISDEAELDFVPLRRTEDFKNKFSFGTAANFALDVQAGGDQFLAVLLFDNPFPIRKAGTFISGDDRISVFIQDNLNSGIQELEFAAFGFRREV